MIPSPADLLRVLSSGFRPDGGGPAPEAPQGADFQSLLAQARAGGLDTGLPVTIADGADVELDPTQLERLGRVVDRAHAEGATRIVVLVDDVALDIDVLSRRVLGTADTSGGRVLTGIDGLVRLHPGDDQPQPMLPLPANTDIDRSLLDLLAKQIDTAA